MDFKDDVIYTLKYDSKNQVLNLNQEKIKNDYVHCLDKYKEDLFKKDENYEYSLYDFEKLISTLNMFNPVIINSNIEKLNKAYCYNLSGRDYDRIKYFGIIKECVNIFKSNPKNDKKVLLNLIFYKNFSNYEDKYFSKVIKNFIEKCFNELEYYTKVATFNKIYEENEKDRFTFLSSHRRKGFNSISFPLKSISFPLSNLEFVVKTNFGFGNSSFLRLKIYYKNNQLISFEQFISKDSQLIDNAFIDYKVKHNQWFEVMTSIKYISDIYCTNEIEFIGIFILKNLEKNIYFCEKIIDKEIIEVDICDDFSESTPYLETLHYKIARICYLTNHINNMLEYRNTINFENIIYRTKYLVKKLIEKLDKEIIISEEKNCKQDKSSTFSNLKDPKNMFLEKIEEFNNFLISCK